MMNWHQKFGFCHGRRLLALVLAMACLPVVAQEVPQAKPVPVDVPAVVAPEGKQILVVPVPETPNPPGLPDEAPIKPGETPEKPGDSPASTAEHPKPDASGVIQRPTTPPHPPDRNELAARPDANGKVKFNFRGQSWPDVLDWLADISAMSLDWQDLPGDFLNLTTRRTYTIEEARDLVNRHLLARGYTLLQNGEVLNVVNLKKLDPGMVPRVEPEELLKRQPHEFVRVSFPLDSLVAEQEVEELKPMLSPNGHLAALKSTNRIEAMDIVVNLRSLYKVLGDEQSEDGQEGLVREFELEHAKASDVQQQLQKLLGIDEKSSGRGGIPMSGMPPEQLQKMIAQQAEMMMAQGQREGQGDERRRGPFMASSQKVEISIVVNARRNSVLALAPPDKLAIIAQAVKMLDVPSGQSPTLTGNLQRMQVYRLAGLDPSVVVKLLEDSGGLEPTTRLQIDEKNKALVAYASLADQMVIRAVIEKLDGSSRRFHVLPLRRLEAEYVAGTIEFMMVGEDKQQQPMGRGYFMYDPSSRRSEREERDKFRVDADIENNRLLLWANEIEIEEVTSLLVKLGEIPDRNSAGSNMRVLSAEPGKDSLELLDNLRRVWPSLAPNPLVLPNIPLHAVPPSGAPRPGVNEGEGESGKPSDTPRPLDGRPAPSNPVLPRRDAALPDANFFRTAQLQRAATQEPKRDSDEETAVPPERDERSPLAQTPEEAASSPPAPVRIGWTPDGRLIVRSDDPRALDLLEDLVGQLGGGKKDFHVFQLKYAQAYWVKLNIQEFFDEEDKDKKSSSRSRNYYFYDSAPPQKQETRRRLSKHRALKLISDPDTNTILVTGADDNQLRIIEELIELYDRPEPTDSKTARVSQIYAVRWSKAQTIADAVKDMYRDLLSSNDKALAQGPEQRNRPQTQNTYIFGDEGGGEKKTQVTFKGKLSFGIDEVSNTLLVSAEGENLLANVMKMVKSLDEAARPSTTVQVLKIQGGVNPMTIRRAIEGVLSDTPQPSAEQNSRGGEQQGFNRRGPRSGGERGGGFGGGGGSRR